MPWFTFPIASAKIHRSATSNLRLVRLYLLVSVIFGTKTKESKGANVEIEEPATYPFQEEMDDDDEEEDCESDGQPSGVDAVAILVAPIDPSTHMKPLGDVTA